MSKGTAPKRSKVTKKPSNIESRLATIEKKQIKKKAALLEALGRIPVVEAATKRVGVPRSTYYRWIREDKKFRKQVMESQQMGLEHFNDLAETKLLQKVSEGEMNAVKFWLRHNSKRYGAKEILEVIIRADQEEPDDALREEIAQRVRMWKKRVTRVHISGSDPAKKKTKKQ